MNFVVGPKFGDVIYSMHLCRTMVMTARGGVSATVWLDPKPHHPMDGTVEEWTENFKTLVPLIEMQPYVTRCHIGRPPSGTPDVVDVTGWRNTCMSPNRSIAESYYIYAGFPLDSETLKLPWMFCSLKEWSVYGRVIVSRSSRYHHGTPDYSAAIGGRPFAFLGTVEERDSFSSEFPELEIKDGNFLTPENFMASAAMISYCTEFVGNQSAPLALAQALGKPRKFERCRQGPDTCWLGGFKEAEIKQKHREFHS